MSVFEKDPITGKVSWEHKEGDIYEVTGVLYRSAKRFRRTLGNWRLAESVNLYRGSKWLVRDGKRHLICRVKN